MSMSTIIHLPRIETYSYVGIMFRLGITEQSVHWNVFIHDRLISGRSFTINAAKSRVKQEIQRGIERYERSIASNASSGKS